MRTANEKVVTNQSGDIARERAIAQLFPTHVHKPPNFERKRDPLCHCTEGWQWQIVPTGGRDTLKMMNAIDELHQQSLARLTWSIASDEFAINSILRWLCVARDFKRDRVLR